LLPVGVGVLALSTSACAGGGRRLPSAFTWILAYQSGQAEGKAEAVRTFLSWSLEEAPQKQAAELGFVPLTGDVLKRAREEVARIKD